MQLRIQKWGNSAEVRLPTAVFRAVRLIHWGCSQCQLRARGADAGCVEAKIFAYSFDCAM